MASALIISLTLAHKNRWNIVNDNLNTMTSITDFHLQNLRFEGYTSTKNVTLKYLKAWRVLHEVYNHKESASQSSLSYSWTTRFLFKLPDVQKGQQNFTIWFHCSLIYALIFFKRITPSCTTNYLPWNSMGWDSFMHILRSFTTNYIKFQQYRFIR